MAEDFFGKLFDRLAGRSAEQNEELKRYEFFADKESREELFKYCKVIAEYLRDEAVPNMIITDRSARPVYMGVHEYFRLRYPHEPVPSIYFVNPGGFKTREDFDSFKDSQISKRKEGDILEEFEHVYKNLVADKDKPVLLFDTCVHTGSTLEPVKRALDLEKFKDVRVGSVNPSDRGSVLKTDFSITRVVPERGCYPFDRDRMIIKEIDHVFSERTNDEEMRERSARLREEIKRIIDEHLKR